MKELAIILLNYNNVNDTLECVKSIEDYYERECTIIVVDNKSTDNSKEKLLENEYRYKLILNDVNEGFAQGNNVGIKWAIKEGYEYIMLLNNDTLITKNSIENMIEEIKKDKKIGIVSPRIMYYPEKEKIWFDGGKIDWFKFIVVHYNMGNNIKSSLKNNNEIVDFITGCCMLIRRDVIEEVGYLPEEYFMYYEDVDYCVKVSEAGYKLVNIKESIIYHKVSSSSGGEDSPFSIKWGTRNRIIFMNKYKYKVSLIKYYSSILFFYLTRLLKLINYRAKRDKARFNAIIEGIKSGKDYIKYDR